MTAQVTVIDYGVGNLTSVRGALEYCGAAIKFCSEPDDVLKADRLLLPGVGAFVDAMNDMSSTGLIEPVREFGKSGKPILGICLGLQMLFSTSSEHGRHNGLSLVEGEVVDIPPTDSDGRLHRIPHMGWNELNPGDRGWAGSVLENVEPGSSVYFAHSFMGNLADGGIFIADCDYGGVSVLAAIQKDNIHGCQFHPEKSGRVGLKIIENYLNL